MKVLGSVKTSILKNTTWQNVNESFHFILEDVENSALRIELKQKLLNCKGKSDGGNTGDTVHNIHISPTDSVLTSLCLGPSSSPSHLGQEAGRDHWEAALSPPLQTVSRAHCMLQTPARSVSYHHLQSADTR